MFRMAHALKRHLHILGGAFVQFVKITKSIGTDLSPARALIPRRYKKQFHIRLIFAASVSLIHLPMLSGLSLMSGSMRPFEKSVTSEREGNKYNMPRYSANRAL